MTQLPELFPWNFPEFHVEKLSEASVMSTIQNKTKTDVIKNINYTNKYVIANIVLIWIVRYSVTAMIICQKRKNNIFVYKSRSAAVAVVRMK